MRIEPLHINVIGNTMQSIIQKHITEHGKARKIVVVSPATDSSHYEDIVNMYGPLVLRKHYGVGTYLSNLFVRIGGYGLRTMFYFINDITDNVYITSMYVNTNNALYSAHTRHLQKKFDEHTYWSTSYMHRYPCRGQRRRSNASTAHKLHLISRLKATSVVSRKKVRRPKKKIKIKLKKKTKQKTAKKKK